MMLVSMAQLFILPEDRTDGYAMQQLHIFGNITSSVLIFQVTNASLGWCEVNSTLRPSTISCATANQRITT